MTTTTFFHLGILVRSLDEAIPRFGQLLGTSFVAPKPLEIAHLVDVEHFGDDRPHPWSGRCTYSREGPPYYELIEAKGRGLFSLDNRDEGLHHVGLLVDDPHGLQADLADQGVRARARILRGPDGPTGVWFSHGPSLHGVPFEFIDGDSRPRLESRWSIGPLLVTPVRSAPSP